MEVFVTGYLTDAEKRELEKLLRDRIVEALAKDKPLLPGHEFVVQVRVNSALRYMSSVRLQIFDNIPSAAISAVETAMLQMITQDKYPRDLVLFLGTQQICDIRTNEKVAA